MALSFEQVKKVVKIIEHVNNKKLPSSPYNDQTKFNIDTILIERNEAGECKNIYINYITLSKDILERYHSTFATQPFSTYVIEIKSKNGKIFQMGWFG